MTDAEMVLAYADLLGKIPARDALKEHYRWGTTRATLARREAEARWGDRYPEQKAEAKSLSNPLVERTVVLSDLHIPFEDTLLVQRVLLWLRTQRLKRLVLNGDTLDCKTISKFAEAKDYPLEDEITRGRVFLDQLQEAARLKNPDCEIDWIDGNHEDRLRKYLLREADKIAGLTDGEGEPLVSIPHLLDLKKRGISYRPYRRVLRLGGNLWIEHGDRVSKHSGYTAKNLVTDKGASIIIGHVHRVGAHYKKDRLGLHVGVEGGCLCRTDPEYLTEDSANWQQGFVVVDHYESGPWWHQSVLVQGGRFIVDGQVW